MGDLTHDDIVEAGRWVLNAMRTYAKVAHGELDADRLFYGYVAGKFDESKVERGFKVRRQHRKKIRTGRIDFRYRGNNSAVIELELRRPHYPQSSLFASQKSDELAKLTRVQPRTAKRRVLLLLDRAQNPIPKDVLQSRYQRSNAGRGNFKAHKIKVLYVHVDGTTYRFPWYPRQHR